LNLIDQSVHRKISFFGLRDGISEPGADRCEFGYFDGAATPFHGNETPFQSSTIPSPGAKVRRYSPIQANEIDSEWRDFPKNG
jgi:hypothetical protein